MLLEDFDKLSCGTLSKTYHTEWAAFLLSATPPSDAMWKSIEETATRLRTLREECAPIEMDDASSSYSDYSDSRTVSTDDESEGEEESSGSKRRRSD